MFKAIKNFFTHNLHINFMGYMKQLFILSGALILASIIGIAVFGLNYSIEFEGGSSIEFNDTGDITITQMRDAFEAAGEPDAVVQTSTVEGKAGFLVRTTEASPDLATACAKEVATALEIDENTYQVTTIGAEWGSNVINRSLIAFIVSILAIAIYIAIRFEYKMGVAAIVSLLHDLLIVVGVYAFTGYEVSPNVIAALLTIMGYSLYDSVVVFHRINENASPDMKCSFLRITNDSINQVFCRTLNTSITTFLPILILFFFGGETLKDFAFAIGLGVILGPYSTIAIATPIYSLWKQREDRYARNARLYPFKDDPEYTTFSQRRALKAEAKVATKAQKALAVNATVATKVEQAPVADAPLDVVEIEEEVAVEETPVEETPVEEAQEDIISAEASASAEEAPAKEEAPAEE